MAECVMGDFKVPLPRQKQRKMSTTSHASDIQAGHCDWLQSDLDDSIFYDSTPTGPSTSGAQLNSKQLMVIEGDFNQLTTKRVSTSTPFSSRTKSHSNDSGFDEHHSQSCSVLSVDDRASSVDSFSSLDFSTQSPVEIAESLTPVTIPKFSLLGPDFSQIQDRTGNTSQDSDSAYGDGSLHSSLHSQQFSDCMSVCSSDSHRMELSVLENLAIGSSGCGTCLSISQCKERSTSPDLSESEHITEVVTQFSPREPDRLIGRKMGLDHVDILRELSDKNIAALDFILEYLDDSSLCVMCTVSSQWNRIVKNNQKADRRKHAFIEASQRRSQKENCCLKQSNSKRQMTGTKGPLTAVQHAVPKFYVTDTKSLSCTNGLHKFQQEAQRLKNDESLRQCPKCRSPARTHNIQERAQCCSKQCGYDFCIKCRNTFHGSKDCSFSIAKKTRTDGTVGTKKSKKNLRRL